jgi:hypothetical protein
VVDKYPEMAPKVGMFFDGEEKAPKMYNTYCFVNMNLFRYHESKQFGYLFCQH